MAATKTSSHSWINDVCREFSQAVGWGLEFVPASETLQTDQDKRSEHSESCWTSEIADGLEVCGKLQLALPTDERADRSFPAVRGMADLVGKLVSRAATTTRSLEARTDELATLVDLGRTLPDQSDLPAAIERLLRAAIQLTAFRSAGFFLLDPRNDALNLRGVAPRDSQTIPSPNRLLAQAPPDLEALTRGRALLIGEEAQSAARWLPGGTAAAVCLAVHSDSGPLGTLWVFDRRKREPSDREIHVLESIAAQVAALLERVVLLQESETQHRLRRDLELASECHAFDVATKLPDEARIEAAVRSTSRFEIGGDLCELIPIDRGRTIVSIGDACGHGISAAVVMSTVRGAVRALSTDPASALRPDEVLARVNQSLHSMTPSHQFMSLFYGVIDMRRRTFTYSNAGHPPPLIVHDGHPDTLESHGMLLGVVSETQYRSSVLPLEPGDALIAFTDGVSEAMNQKRKMFRSDGVLEVVRAQAGSTPQTILNAIWSQVETHVGGARSEDDRSLMVLRIR